MAVSFVESPVADRLEGSEGFCTVSGDRAEQLELWTKVYSSSGLAPVVVRPLEYAKARGHKRDRQKKRKPDCHQSSEGAEVSNRASAPPLRIFSVLELFVAYCNSGKASTFTPLFGSQVAVNILGLK